MTEQTPRAIDWQAWREEFPTLPHAFLARAAQGIETHLVASPDNIGVPLETFEAALDELRRPALH